MKFTESSVCASGGHCKVCRARAGGAGFRQAISKMYDTDGDAWDCPHGRPWEYTPPRPGPSPSGQPQGQTQPTTRLVVPEDIRQMDWLALGKVIGDLPSPKREMGLAVFAEHSKRINGNCESCGAMKAAAAVRVWLVLNRG